MSRARVAIVDPDLDGASLCALVVERIGHEPIIVRPGTTPPEPDVLLVEPASAASLALARRLRCNQPEMPIVCISRRSPQEETLLLEPLRYLVKPVRLEELRGALTEAVAAAPSLANA